MCLVNLQVCGKFVPAGSILHLFTLLPPSWIGDQGIPLNHCCPDPPPAQVCGKFIPAGSILHLSTLLGQVLTDPRLDLTLMSESELASLYGNWAAINYKTLSAGVCVGEVRGGGEERGVRGEGGREESGRWRTREKCGGLGRHPPHPTMQQVRVSRMVGGGGAVGC